ncbi:MAG: hypothetical protein IJP70_03010 [Bacteroidales bacterium]|nr:hypothetical protein [Bacteroidales bacterium]
MVQLEAKKCYSCRIFYGFPYGEPSRWKYSKTNIAEFVPTESAGTPQVRKYFPLCRRDFRKSGNAFRCVGGTSASQEMLSAVSAGLPQVRKCFPLCRRDFRKPGNASRCVGGNFRKSENEKWGINQQITSKLAPIRSKKEEKCSKKRQKFWQY